MTNTKPNKPQTEEIKQTTPKVEEVSTTEQEWVKNFRDNRIFEDACEGCDRNYIEAFIFEQRQQAAEEATRKEREKREDEVKQAAQMATQLERDRCLEIIDSHGDDFVMISNFDEIRDKIKNG